MTTVAVVRKQGVAAVAADTLTKWGSAKESALYIANHEKILKVGESLIAVTGFGQESDRTRARDAGFDGHLTKPAEPDAILAALSPEAQPK